MKYRLSIATTEELLRLRNFLQQISQISYSFSKINQNYPLDTIDEKGANQLRHIYHGFIEEAQKIIDAYKEVYG